MISVGSLVVNAVGRLLAHNKSASILDRCSEDIT